MIASTTLMKQYVESIALPMTEMFNSMIRSGIFPNNLNIASHITLQIR